MPAGKSGCAGEESWALAGDDGAAFAGVDENGAPPAGNAGCAEEDGTVLAGESGCAGEEGWALAGDDGAAFNGVDEDGAPPAGNAGCAEEDGTVLAGESGCAGEEGWALAGDDGAAFAGVDGDGTPPVAELNAGCCSRSPVRFTSTLGLTAFSCSIISSVCLFNTSRLMRRLMAASGCCGTRLMVEAIPTTRRIFPSANPPVMSSRRDALARSADSSQLLYPRSPLA